MHESNPHSPFLTDSEKWYSEPGVPCLTQGKNQAQRNQPRAIRDNPATPGQKKRLKKQEEVTGMASTNRKAYISYLHGRIVGQ